MVIKLVRTPIEVIEKIGNDKFRGITKAKTFRGWISGMINKSVKNNNKETEFIMLEVLKAYNHFNPESSLDVEVTGWHGKSSFEIIKEIDRIKIIKYQRSDKNSEPSKIVTEASREEINALIESILVLWEGNPIKTSKLAMEFSRRLDLGHNTWKEFFADRSWHNKLTLMLDALESLGLIRYNGGLTEVLDNNLSIQKVLK